MQNPGFNGFDNNPKPLQRLNIVIARNTDWVGVTETVKTT